MKTPTLQILGDIPPTLAHILSPEALQFVENLEREFGGRRLELLERRQRVQADIDAGKLPDFLPETKAVREGNWRVGPIPADLLDRRVEITGPVERKMVINALNSGARVFMADFEDSNSPTWNGCLQGQQNMMDAVRRTIAFTSPEGKAYALNPKTATLIVRPRGWHLWEKKVRFGDRFISASLFDFGLYFFHNAQEALKRGTGPYFYLPKMESHLEARLWNDVFVFSQKTLGLPVGTIKATVLIETVLAAFEMDEILYELREHCVGLNCGRWDYIFSFIKKFAKRADFILPNRALVTMNQHFLKSYCELLIQTCHRRGAFAMGGMAAQIPIKDNAAANQQAMEKVQADKQREVKLGHDGTWVAHPGLVGLAMEVFDAGMKGPNQLNVLREDVKVTAKDLLTVPTGAITEAGMRMNISVGVQYMESWLRGNGCVPLYHLMEDAATAEISRAQLWQWIHHGQTQLEDGRKITPALFREFFSEELGKIRTRLGQSTNPSAGSNRFELAAKLFESITLENEFAEFLTISAYEHL